MKLKNPCYDIKSWHCHSSGIKNKEMPRICADSRVFVFPSTMSDPFNHSIYPSIPERMIGPTGYWSDHPTDIVFINGEPAPTPPSIQEVEDHREKVLTVITAPVVKVQVLVNHTPIGPPLTLHQYKPVSPLKLVQSAREIASSFLNKIALVTQYYHDVNPVRNEELRFSVCENIKNPYIDEVYLLQNGKDVLPLTEEYLMTMCNPQWNVSPSDIVKKVRIIEDTKLPVRIRFSDLLAFAQSHLQGMTVLISNADIFFDDSLHELKTNQRVFRDLVLNRAHYFLSRYERNEEEHVGTQCSDKYEGSHDTFIYTPGRDYQELVSKVEFELGSWGIENRILFEARSLGTCRSYFYPKALIAF